MAVWTHIAHSALSLPAATVTWTGISGSYDHLCIKVSARSDQSAYRSFINTTFNNDTGSNYSHTRMEADSATPSAASGSSVAFLGYWPIAGDSCVANTFGTLECWIPNYSNSSNFKPVHVSSVVENDSTTNSQWGVRKIACLWSATAAITEIDFVLDAGDDFMAYSTFDLYGILGA